MKNLILMGLLLALVQQKSYGHNGPQFNAQIKSLQLSNSTPMVITSTVPNARGHKLMRDGKAYYLYPYQRENILFRYVEVLFNHPRTTEETEAIRALARLRQISDYNYPDFTAQLQKDANHFNEEHGTTSAEGNPTIVELYLDRKMNYTGGLFYILHIVLSTDNLEYVGSWQNISTSPQYVGSCTWSAYDKIDLSFIHGILLEKIGQKLRSTSAEQEEGGQNLVGDGLDDPFFDQVLGRQDD